MARFPAERAGRIAREIPRLRKGSCFTGFLGPRRAAEKALVALAMGLEPWRQHGSLREACVHGVSTRPVDDLVRATG